MALIMLQLSSGVVTKKLSKVQWKFHQLYLI